MQTSRFLAAPRTAPRAALLAIALSALLPVSPAWSQLPPAPTPVPGSLLDRPGPASFEREEEAELPPEDGDSADLPAPAAAPPGPRTLQIAFGTAFRVNEAGHLVTSRHIVEGCRAIGIVVGDKAVGKLSVLSADPQHDLALLSGPPGKETAVFRPGDELFQGEDVLSYGYPLPGILSSGGQLGAGMVTALSGIRNDPAQMQVDVPLQTGNSGGPLLDRRGQVVGVVFAKLNALRVSQLTGDLPQNVNFAVRTGPVKRLLAGQGIEYREGRPDAAVRSNQEIAAQARNWTVPIACQRERIQR